jgi:hypothetical protein
MEDTPEEALEHTTHSMDEKSPLQATPKEPQISLHALSSFSTPQTLKLIGYIKHHKVIVLIENNSTYNFIHRRVAQNTHCYVHHISNFQIMIANGGTTKCGGRYENVKLQMGKYHLKTHMFSIEMGGSDIVLGSKWLCTLGLVTMDFMELFMCFMQEGKKHILKRITSNSPEIITSHRMEKLLNKGHMGVIAKFNTVQLVDIRPP